MRELAIWYKRRVPERARDFEQHQTPQARKQYPDNFDKPLTGERTDKARPIERAHAAAEGEADDLRPIRDKRRHWDRVTSGHHGERQRDEADHQIERDRRLGIKTDGIDEDR
jgi:hypothetical protein